MRALEYPIDENADLKLTLTPGDDGRVMARLHSAYTQESLLVKHILPLMSFTVGGETIMPQTDRFSLPAPAPGAAVDMRINGQDFARFMVAGDTVTATPLRTLCAFETRMIGRAPQNDIPGDLPAQGELQTPITDLHTHLSAQIGAQDLIRMGCAHHLLYPCAMLESLGIDYPKDDLRQAPRRSFLPLGIRAAPGETESVVDLATLAAPELATLAKALSHSPERQETFLDMEKCYYLREPFTKDKSLFAEMLERIAQGYAAEGIRYAELSSNAVLDPAWLDIAHAALPAIEAKTGVQLRFMAGLPRTLDEAALTARIGQIKRVAASPYIVGVDVFGHEINKTSHLDTHLAELARWMHVHQSDLILQIHAGENSKNPGNAREALELAKKHGIRVRLIHALYGMDRHTRALATELTRTGQVLIAYCQDSNLTLNHIDFAHEVNIMHSIEAGIPTVLGSDGASFYGLSAKQIAMSAALCGVTREGFEAMHATERAHIARQQTIFEHKQAALPHDFFTPKTVAVASSPALAKPSDAATVTPQLQALFDSPRTPILIAGAAGSSWDALKETDRKETVRGLILLLESLDPEQVYFIGGRTKDRGIGIELGKAIAAYNQRHSPRHFDYVIKEAQGGENEAYNDAGINHRQRLCETIAASPSALVTFVKEHNGAALFFGGRQLTRDFIVTAQNQGLPFGLMHYASYRHAPNASLEKARLYPGQAFSGAKGLVRYAHRIGLCPPPDLPRLQAEYAKLCGSDKARDV